MHATLYIITPREYLLFEWLHVCINVLNVVVLLEALNNLVDCSTLLLGNVLQVVRNTCKLTTCNLKALLLECLLNCAERLRITVDCNFVLLLVILLLYTVVNEVENQFVHVKAVLLCECKHALLCKHEVEATLCTKCTTELIEDSAYVGNGTCSVVSCSIYKDCDTERTVALVWYLLVSF